MRHQPIHRIIGTVLATIVLVSVSVFADVAPAVAQSNVDYYCNEGNPGYDAFLCDIARRDAAPRSSRLPSPTRGLTCEQLNNLPFEVLYQDEEALWRAYECSPPSSAESRATREWLEQYLRDRSTIR